MVGVTVLVCSVVAPATQGYTFGWVYVEELSLWVPSNGKGALLDVEVTAGGATPATTAPLPPPTLPWSAWIEPEVPLVSVYRYAVPVE